MKVFLERRRGYLKRSKKKRQKFIRRDESISRPYSREDGRSPSLEVCRREPNGYKHMSFGTLIST